MSSISAAEKPASLRSILGLLHLGADRVRPGGSAARPAGADIEVMLGEDAPK
ncbi:MAG TPA: hypothetical protein VKY74_23560 [Chloroflexia bacterium]|nr:hypothetical protein [Chloroflexia bacterium]